MADEVTISVRAEDNFSSVLGNFGSIMTGIESIVNLAGQAFDFAKDMVGDFINSASESEQAVARLDGVLRATGGSVGFTSEQLQGMADGLQDVTRFSDETILNGEAILLTFRNLSGEMFERTVPAMLDMAEIFGSVDSAAMQLGKALNDPVAGMGALSRAGITFSEEQKEMIENFIELGDVASAQNIILSEVEAQVGGLAEAMGLTFAGQVDIFQNKLDTLREMIGNAFLPTISDLVGAFGNFVASPAVIEFIDELSQSISDFIEPYSLLAQVVMSRIENGSDPLTALISTLENYNGSTGIGNFVDGLLEVINTIQNFIETGESEGWGVAIGNLFSSLDVSGSIQELVNNLVVIISGADFTPVGEVLSAVIGGALQVALEGLDTIVNDVDWRPLGNAIKEAIEEAMAGAFDGSDLSYAFQQWMYDMGNPYFWRGLGQDIVDGIKEGIQVRWNNLLSIVSFGWDDLFRLVKTKLGISSPSTIFRGFAINIVEGLISGWNSLFDTFLDLISSGIDAILDLFAPFLALFGIDVSSGVGGSTGGGSGTNTPPGGGGSGEAQTVNNYFYGPVYIGSSLDDANYDCPSPNPIVAASANQLVATGY